MKKISDFAEIIMGQSPKGSSYNKNGKGVPLLNGAADFDKMGINPIQYTSEPTKTCKKGDILLCIRATIGNAIFADKEYCLGRGVCAIRIKEKGIVPEYVLLLLGKKVVDLVAMAEGSTIKGIRKNDLENLEFDIPKERIQKQIVAILQRVEKLALKREQANQLTNKLIQSIFLKMFGDPVTNPMRWKVKRIGDLIKITSGDYFKLKEYSDHGVRLLKINNVSFERIIWDEVSYLPKEYANKFKHLVLKEGDILIALNRPIIRNRLKFGMLRESDAPSILYQRVGRLDILDQRMLDRRFLFGFMSTPQFLNSLFAKLTGSDQPYINPTQLVKIDIYVPPINLQKKFAAIFENLKSMEKNQERSTKEINELSHSLMQRAFTGRLFS